MRSLALLRKGKLLKDSHKHKETNHMSKSTSKDYQLNVNLFTALLDGTFEKVVKQKKVKKVKK